MCLAIDYVGPYIVDKKIVYFLTMLEFNVRYVYEISFRISFWKTDLLSIPSEIHNNNNNNNNNNIVVLLSLNVFMK